MRPELTEALEERLRNTPDPDAVLAGVLAGVERRRFRRRAVHIGGAVVAVLAVLATAVTVGRMRDADVPGATGKPVGIERTTTIELGWIPDDLEPPDIESTRIGDAFHYRSRAGSHRLSVWVDNLGWKPPFDTALGPHESWTEVNGRRARVTLCCGYAEVAFELPSGRWAVVARIDYAQGQYTAAPETLRSQALRVAASIREGSGVRLRVGFELDYLAPGHQVIGLRTTSGAPPGFGQVITDPGPLLLKGFRDFSPGESTRGPKVIVDQVSAIITVVLEQPEPGQLPSPNTSVQGRLAYSSADERRVRVADFHGGLLTVYVTYPIPDPGPMLLPMEELTKVAAGVRWVG